MINLNFDHIVQSNYYVTDHLGSTRMVVSSNDSIRETINYYPFGSEMKMENPALLTNDFLQPFRFTGKELDMLNSLNMYDFGARLYDVAGVPMWTSVDPLAEKNPSVTPYHFCHNNPINRIDLDGRDDFFNEKGEFIKRTDEGSAVMVMSGDQYKNISEVDFSDSKSVIENIGSHYLAKADKSEFSLTASSTGGNISQDAVFSNNAGTPYYNNYLTNGFVNNTLGNCFNFECVAYHESTHRYDSSTNESNIGEVNAIIRTANECPAWGNANEDYIHSQASYAEKSLNDYAGNKVGYVNKLNDAFVGYATFSLQGTNVSHVNNKRSLEKWEIIGKKRQR